MNSSETRDINVLLLGETGVGKSTFINAFVNYLQHDDFRSALDSDPVILIPTLATVTDVDGNSISIKEGESDDNEFQEVGASATQDVKTYVCPISEQNILIRMIDSPGMGDTRGLDVDNDHCEHIFTYLSQLKELHAICFLMKPTNTRNTVYFEYCLKQILSRLDSSACANIIFVFTNTRGSDYTPGDTLPCLKEIIKKLEANSARVKIPASVKQNVFCLDNEPFKTWIAYKKGIELNHRLLKACNESWDISSNECKRLFAYVSGEDPNFPLKPHLLQSTTSINEARRIILQLSKPSADISQLIDDNIRILGQHKYELSKENQTLSELKEKLYIPITNIAVEHLDDPRTVCTSSKCMDVYSVNGVNKWHYRQICCDRCYASFIPEEKIGNAVLWICSAINWRGVCKECNCNLSTHQHVYYLTKPVDDKIVDESVKANINDKERARKEMEKLIHEMDQRQEELENERKFIVESTAKFTLFLERHAIAPYNDAYKGYITYLIDREKSLGNSCDAARIRNLEDLLRKYDNIKDTFKNDQNLHADVRPLTPEDINEIVSQLYNLKHNGKKIKELFENQNLLRKRENEKKSKYAFVEVKSSRFRGKSWSTKIRNFFT